MNKEDINLMSGDVADAVLMSDDPNLFKDNLQVHEGGRKYKTMFTKKFLERKSWSAPNPNEIRSIIPGSVTEILVKAKDKVKKGDKLMIYEAMKMKNVITAPFDGTIKSINAKLGDKLPKGVILLVMLPDKPKKK